MWDWALVNFISTWPKGLTISHYFVIHLSFLKLNFTNLNLTAGSFIKSLVTLSVGCQIQKLPNNRKNFDGTDKL